MIVAVACLSGPLQLGTKLGPWWSATSYTVTLDDGTTYTVPHDPAPVDAMSKIALSHFYDVRDWVAQGGVPTEAGVARVRPGAAS